MQWKRKEQALRLYHGRIQVRVKKIEGDYFVSLRDTHGHWHHKGERASKQEALSLGYQLLMKEI